MWQERVLNIIEILARSEYCSVVGLKHKNRKSSLVFLSMVDYIKIEAHVTEVRYDIPMRPLI